MIIYVFQEDHFVQYGKQIEWTKNAGTPANELLQQYRKIMLQVEFDGGNG